MRLARGSLDSRRVEATHNFANAEALEADPMEDLPHRLRLGKIDDVLGGPPIALLADVAIAIGRPREHIDAAAPGAVQLAPAVALHDLGPFVFGNHALHLQQ
jgi:hypothetical protein